MRRRAAARPLSKPAKSASMTAASKPPKAARFARSAIPRRKRNRLTANRFMIGSGRFLTNRPLRILEWIQCSLEAWHDTKAAVESDAANMDKAYENAKS